MRTVKEKQNSQNTAGSSPAGVQANLPKPANSSSDTKQSNDATDKKEELTNYEISSKQVTTTSEAMSIKGLSVAVLINRSALQASLGDKATPDAVDKQVKEIEQLVISAAGLRKDRGDEVKISVVDFVDAGQRPRTGRAAFLPRDPRTPDGDDHQRRRGRSGGCDADLVRHPPARQIARPAAAPRRRRRRPPTSAKCSRGFATAPMRR